MAACGVCGHDDGSRMADSCWEAQQRMQRAEEQAKVAAVELAAQIATRDFLARENVEARALLARSAERRCDCDDEPAGKVCIPCDARAFLETAPRRDEAPETGDVASRPPRCKCGANLSWADPMHAPDCDEPRRCTCAPDCVSWQWRPEDHDPRCPARDEGPREVPGQCNCGIGGTDLDDGHDINCTVMLQPCGCWEPGHDDRCPARAAPTEPAPKPCRHCGTYHESPAQMEACHAARDEAPGGD